MPPHDFDAMLNTAIDLLKADKGNVQLLDAAANSLRIVSHAGFNAQFLKHFETVIPGYCACGLALKLKRRVVIDDVFTDPRFSHLGPIFASYGYVAVQSTPLLGPEGNVFGVLSTHFAAPRHLGGAELAALDDFLRDALGNASATPS